MSRYMLVLLIGLLSSQEAIAGSAKESPGMRVTPVARNIYMLEGPGGNIAASIGKDGILIVDDQVAQVSAELQSTIDSFDSGPLKFVINTHWHHDHTGGNAHFGKSATLVAHTNVLKRLSSDQFISFLNKNLAAQPKHALPKVTFDQSLSIHFNGEEIHVLHYPTGHTDGDSVVYFKRSNVIHLGDHFFNRRYPFVDLSSGGSIDGLIKNLERILDDLPDDVRIIPGHGPLANKSDLKRYLDTIRETVKHVRAEIKYGKHISTVQREGLKQKYAPWGEGFISEKKWIETIFLDWESRKAS